MNLIKRINNNLWSGRDGFISLFGGFLIILLGEYLVASIYLLVIAFLIIYVIEDTLNNKGKITRDTP